MINTRYALLALLTCVGANAITNYIAQEKNHILKQLDELQKVTFQEVINQTSANSRLLPRGQNNKAAPVPEAILQYITFTRIASDIEKGTDYAVARTNEIIEKVYEKVSQNELAQAREKIETARIQAGKIVKADLSPMTIAQLQTVSRNTQSPLKTLKKIDKIVTKEIEACMSQDSVTQTDEEKIQQASVCQSIALLTSLYFSK